ncbi:MAG: spermidine synthase [Deferrisomatales bacterium]
MAQPWQILDSVCTPDGTLELRRRGERDFLITLDGRVLMNSALHRSEAALGRLACRGLKGRPGPRVLVGGLGMGFTLRAVLDVLPPSGRAVVAELNPQVVRWCEGPLAELTDRAAQDPRVEVRVEDVAEVIRRVAAGKAEDRFDAVVLDLYEGPHAGSHKRSDPLYGHGAIGRAKAALRPGGVFAVWGENHDAGFEKRLRGAGFSVTTDRPGRGGLRHTIYIAAAGRGLAPRPRLA